MAFPAKKKTPYIPRGQTSDIHYGSVTPDTVKVARLFEYASQNNVELLSQFVTENKMAYNLYNRDEETLIHAALTDDSLPAEKKAQRRALIQHLLSRNVNVAKANVHDITALHMAVGLQDYELVRLLVMSGAETSTPDWNGMTPLHYSVMGKLKKCDRKRHMDLIENVPDAARISNAGLLEMFKLVKREVSRNWKWSDIANDVDHFTNWRIRIIEGAINSLVFTNPNVQDIQKNALYLMLDARRAVAYRRRVGPAVGAALIYPHLSPLTPQDVLIRAKNMKTPLDAEMVQKLDEKSEGNLRSIATKWADKLLDQDALIRETERAVAGWRSALLELHKTRVDALISTLPVQAERLNKGFDDLLVDKFTEAKTGYDDVIDRMYTFLNQSITRPTARAVVGPMLVNIMNQQLAKIAADAGAAAGARDMIEGLCSIVGTWSNIHTAHRQTLKIMLNGFRRATFEASRTKDGKTALFKADPTTLAAERRAAEIAAANAATGATATAIINAINARIANRVVAAVAVEAARAAGVGVVPVPVNRATVIRANINRIALSARAAAAPADQAPIFNIVTAAATISLSEEDIFDTVRAYYANREGRRAAFDHILPPTVVTDVVAGADTGTINATIDAVAGMHIDQKTLLKNVAASAMAAHKPPEEIIATLKASLADPLLGNIPRLDTIFLDSSATPADLTLGPAYPYWPTWADHAVASDTNIPAVRDKLEFRWRNVFGSINDEYSIASEIDRFAGGGGINNMNAAISDLESMIAAAVSQGRHNMLRLVALLQNLKEYKLMAHDAAVGAPNLHGITYNGAHYRFAERNGATNSLTYVLQYAKENFPEILNSLKPVFGREYDAINEVYQQFVRESEQLLAMPEEFIGLLNQFQTALAERNNCQWLLHFYLTSLPIADHAAILDKITKAIDNRWPIYISDQSAITAVGAVAGIPVVPAVGAPVGGVIPHLKHLYYFRQYLPTIQTGDLMAELIPDLSCVPKTGINGINVLARYSGEQSWRRSVPYSGYPFLHPAHSSFHNLQLAILDPAIPMPTNYIENNMPIPATILQDFKSLSLLIKLALAQLVTNRLHFLNSPLVQDPTVEDVFKGVLQKEIADPDVKKILISFIAKTCTNTLLSAHFNHYVQQSVSKYIFDRLQRKPLVGNLTAVLGLGNNEKNEHRVNAAGAIIAPQNYTHIRGLELPVRQKLGQLTKTASKWLQTNITTLLVGGSLHQRLYQTTTLALENSMLDSPEEGKYSGDEDKMDQLAIDGIRKGTGKAKELFDGLDVWTEGHYNDPKCREYDPKITLLLLNAKASVQAQNRDGSTPLHTAIECGNIRALRILLKRGAIVEGTRSKNLKMLTPLAYLYDNIKDRLEIVIKPGTSLDYFDMLKRFVTPTYKGLRKGLAEKFRENIPYGLDILCSTGLVMWNHVIWDAGKSYNEEFTLEDLEKLVKVLQKYNVYQGSFPDIFPSLAHFDFKEIMGRDDFMAPLTSAKATLTADGIAARKRYNSLQARASEKTKELAILQAKPANVGRTVAIAMLQRELADLQQLIISTLTEVQDMEGGSLDVDDNLQRLQAEPVTTILQHALTETVNITASGGGKAIFGADIIEKYDNLAKYVFRRSFTHPYGLGKEITVHQYHSYDEMWKAYCTSQHHLQNLENIPMHLMGLLQVLVRQLKSQQPLLEDLKTVQKFCQHLRNELGEFEIGSTKYYDLDNKTSTLSKKLYQTVVHIISNTLGGLLYQAVLELLHHVITENERMLTRAGAMIDLDVSEIVDKIAQTQFGSERIMLHDWITKHVMPKLVKKTGMIYADQYDEDRNFEWAIFFDTLLVTLKNNPHYDLTEQSPIIKVLDSKFSEYWEAVITRSISSLFNIIEGWHRYTFSVMHHFDMLTTMLELSS